MTIVKKYKIYMNKKITIDKILLWLKINLFSVLYVNDKQGPK